MATSSLAEVALELAPFQQLQPLLDASYPRPQRDMFECLVMLSPHSKGGHFKNLTAAPARGQG